jgi:hypothetical protein
MDSGFNRQSIGLFDHFVGARERRRFVSLTRSSMLLDGSRLPSPFSCRQVSEMLEQ